VRYYSIALTPPTFAGQGPQLPTKTWTSYPGGKIDPGALQVEMDILGSFLGIPGGDVGACTVTIHGIPLSDLRQAQNYFGSTISVSGGFKKGLPLASPSQSGLLVKGTVWQSFSNWIGDDMSLTFVIVPSFYTQDINRGDFSFSWSKGQPLSDAIQTALKSAYPPPRFKINMAIGNYSTPQFIGHKIETLIEFSQFINSHIKGLINIFMWDGVNVFVTDNSVQPKPKILNFIDLIGQPKWVNFKIMQFMTPMRADIQINTLVNMPQGLPDAPGTVTTTAVSAPSQAKYQSAFQGSFTVQSVRHVGNFRDPDGASWSSIFEAFPNAV
jgi:hypothetical protein